MCCVCALEIFYELCRTQAAATPAGDNYPTEAKTHSNASCHRTSTAQTFTAAIKLGSYGFRLSARSPPAYSLVNSGPLEAMQQTLVVLLRICLLHLLLVIWTFVYLLQPTSELAQVGIGTELVGITSIVVFGIAGDGLNYNVFGAVEFHSTPGSVGTKPPSHSVRTWIEAPISQDLAAGNVEMDFLVELSHDLNTILAPASQTVGRIIQTTGDQNSKPGSFVFAGYCLRNIRFC